MSHFTCIVTLQVFLNYIWMQWSIAFSCAFYRDGKKRHLWVVFSFYIETPLLWFGKTFLTQMNFCDWNLFIIRQFASLSFNWLSYVDSCQIKFLIKTINKKSVSIFILKGCASYNGGVPFPLNTPLLNFNLFCLLLSLQTHWSGDLWVSHSSLFFIFVIILF